VSGCLLLVVFAGVAGVLVLLEVLLLVVLLVFARVVEGAGVAD
jgi:hypothetical protein